MGGKDEMIYNTLSGELVKYASALVGPDDGPDLLSTVVTRVLAKQRLEDLDNPRLYLFKAIGNEARSHKRRYATRQVVRLIASDSVAASEHDAALNAVMALPVRQRSATYLVYWLDYTPTEAADVMGCRPGTVRRYLHLARRKLEGVLDGKRERNRARGLFREVYEHIDDESPQAPDWAAVREGGVTSDPHRSASLVALTVAVGVLIVAVGFVGRPRSEVSISPGNAAADVTGSQIAIGSTTTTLPLDFGSCPVTIPPQPGFQPTDGHPIEPVFGVWYGTEGLWTVLETDGSYRPRKAVFWSANFLGGIREGQPEVFVTWRRLDGTGEVIDSGGYSTNGKDQSGDFMIAGFDTNRAGCWEVTATYKGATLVYVYFVPGAPSTPDPTTTTLPVIVDPLFGEELPWVLLFDDGFDGVLVVDPTSRVASRSVVEGQRPGNQPYRLKLVENRLIVGWDGIYATDIYARKPVLLGAATIFLPAFRSDRVWLIDYPDGGLGVGTPLAWQVSVVTGAPLSDPTTIGIEGFPAIGIPGGLAIETDTGIALWDADSGDVTTVLGTGSSFVSDISQDRDARVAWCEDPCTEMHITSIASGDDLVITARGGEAFDARSARFSSDRRFLAAPAGSRVVVVDLENVADYVDFFVPGTEPFVFVSWAPTGPDLFASTRSFRASSTTIVWHDALRKTTASAELPFGGALSFVVIDRNQAFGFLGDGSQSPSECPTPMGPSGRTSICSFGF